MATTETIMQIGGQGGSCSSRDYGPGKRMSKIAVWAVCDTIRGVKMWSTNDTDCMAPMLGLQVGDRRDFSIPSTEWIKSLSLWDNGVGTRLGRIRIVLSSGSIFDFGMTRECVKAKERPISVGSGICVGWTARSGDDVDALGFKFLAATTETIMQIGGQGGHCSSRDYAPGIRMTKIAVWAACDKIRGVKIWSTDDTDCMAAMLGLPEGNCSDFSIPSTEWIKSLSLWDNGVGTRLGRIRIVLSGGSRFDYGWTGECVNAKERQISVGSGICVGWTARSGDDVDALGFKFLAATTETTKQCSTTSRVTEFTLAWPQSNDTRQSLCHTGSGSTHELVFDGRGYVWVSGQKYDHVARVAYDGSATFFALPENSCPHGLVFDPTGHLWVSLEGPGVLIRVNTRNGWDIVETVDVSMTRDGGAHRINTGPHGLALDKDGSVWFTGKYTSTVGRVSKEVNNEWKVSHFPLLTMGSLPIYIAGGPEGNFDMWCTELTGNAIARISPKGVVKEYLIPTANSRPITIVVSPNQELKSMWFTQESGANIGRIDMDGKITEFPIPLAERDVNLAGHTFDRFGNFWVQQYVNPPRCYDGNTGNDYIVKLGNNLHKATSNDLTDVSVTFYKVPSQRTIMHRILQAPDADGTMWFTQLGPNKIGFIKPNQE